MAKFLIITKEKDYISTGYKKIAKELRGKCQVYDENGTLVHPAKLYDGEDREWAKEFIATHKVGDSTSDAREEWIRNRKENIL